MRRSRPPRGGFFHARSTPVKRQIAFWLPVAAAAGLVACVSAPLPDAEGWHAVTLPGKTATRYGRAHKDGRTAWHAQADRSASLWRRHWRVEASRLGAVRFSWWVPGPLPGADFAVAGLTDAPAQVLFAFDGDHARLPGRTRLQYDLAETLTGERPPFATLKYAFGNDPAQVGQVIVHPRTDRIRTLVLDAGTAPAGRWREHRRDLVADFRRAFGEPPGALLSVALLTDGDNTGQLASAWYGPIDMEAPPR